MLSVGSQKLLPLKIDKTALGIKRGGGGAGTDLNKTDPSPSPTHPFPPLPTDAKMLPALRALHPSPPHLSPTPLTLSDRGGGGGLAGVDRVSW